MIYLHIGLHKTGTSTIQQFAAHNVDLLARNGFIYPSIGRQREAHHQLMNDSRGEADSRLVNELAEFARSRPRKNILISAEGLSILSGKEVKKFVEPLAQVSDIRVLLYVRGSAGRFVSSYNQTTKRSYNLLSFDEYFEWRADGKPIEQTVTKWARAVGHDAIRVRTLEKPALVGGDLLTDFCSALGMAEGVMAQATPESLQPTNVAVPWEAAEFVREFGVRAGLTLMEMDAAERKQFEAELSGTAQIVSAKNTMERKVRRDTVRPRNFVEVCEAALAPLGPAKKAQYLTPEQARKLDDEYQAQLSAIAEKVRDARLDHTPPPLPGERPFEPSFAAMDPQRREALRVAVRDHYGWRERAPTLYRLIEGMKEPRA